MPSKVTVRNVSIALGAVVALAAGSYFLRTPSMDRSWAEDQVRLADVSIAGDVVTLGGLRDFEHGEDGASRARYRDWTFSLGDVQRVWFALAPFASRFRGLAHSFVTFELADGRFLAVSVEARRETDEDYSLLGGVLRGFEIAYVIGTEEDLIGLRALRGDEIYLYPSVATPQQSAAILGDMLERAARTQAEPEFYNTLINNCATNLRDHVNRATEADLPWGWGVLLPGYADALALDQGLLDTDLGLAAARSRFRVDRKARAALETGAGDFSRRIRESGAP